MRRLLVALVLLAVLPVPAHAGNVGLVVTDEDIGDGASAREADIGFTGAEGERNEVTITRQGTVLVFTDAGAPITLVNEAIKACTLPDANTARCTVPVGADNGFFNTVDADLGDRNDTLTVNGTEVVGVDGGGGNDTLTIASGRAGSSTSVTSGMAGGPGSDTLTGGPGPDRLDGGTGPDLLDGRAGDDELGGDDGLSGGGNDRLLGGAGNDALTGDAAVTALGPAPQTPITSGADVLDGGPGLDRVVYVSQPGPVTIDLAAQTAAGPAGEGDTLAGIEGAVGTAAGDVLAGGPAGDLLDGRGGADRITGAGGGDVLSGGDGPDAVDGAAGDDIVAGGAGADVLSGGPGDDSVDASERDGAIPVDDSESPAVRDTVTCADGVDAVVLPNVRQPLKADCERVDLATTGGVLDARPAAAGATGAVFRLRCARRRERSDRCELALALRSPTGVLLAKARPSFRGSAPATTYRVRLAPTIRGRTALRRSLAGARMEATRTFAGGVESLAKRSWVLAP